MTAIQGGGMTPEREAELREGAHAIAESNLNRGSDRVRWSNPLQELLDEIDALRERHEKLIKRVRAKVEHLHDAYPYERPVLAQLYDALSDATDGT